MRIIISVLFIVLASSFFCRAQTDTLQKKDSIGFILPPYNIYSSVPDKNPSSIYTMSFDWEKMSTPGNFFQDPVSVRQMQMNRIIPSTKTMFIYNNHTFYFDDPLQPYGKNDIPSVLILGTLDYFFQWLEEK